MTTKRVAVADEFTWQNPVKDKDLSTPPGSPAKGDRYIIAATGSGAWVSQTGNIALCTVGGGSPSWEFVTKVEGMICWVEDENLFYRCDGTNWGLLDFVKNDGTVNPTNLLINGDFENWSLGISSSPDNWLLFGAGGSVAREDTIIKIGTYSSKVTRVGADTSIYQWIHLPKGINYFKGRKLTLGCWVYATVADRARIFLYDNAASATYSSYHTGDSTWQFLTVSFTVDSSADRVQISCIVDTGNTSAYFDGVMCVEGESAFAFAPKPESVDNKSIDGTFASNSDTLYPSQKAVKTYADTKFGSVAKDTQTFTGSGTWNKPSSGTLALIQIWGGGGSGGRGNMGGGGGGGGYSEQWILLSILGSSEVVTIGSGGAAVIVNGNGGNIGGSSTFGIFARAAGGGGGSGSSYGGGGGGGSEFKAGTSGVTTVAGVAGWIDAGDGATGSGASPGNPGLPGRTGGGGGGAGKVENASNGGAGGASGFGGGGGAGAGYAAGGTGGISVYGGNGGNGGRSNLAGTVGIQPGGGGGGSYTGYNSGAGGNGKCIVTVF